MFGGGRFFFSALGQTWICPCLSQNEECRKFAGVGKYDDELWMIYGILGTSLCHFETQSHWPRMKFDGFAGPWGVGRYVAPLHGASWMEHWPLFWKKHSTHSIEHWSNMFKTHWVSFSWFPILNSGMLDWLGTWFLWNYISWFDQVWSYEIVQKSRSISA